jgi:hypothetical protein
LQRKYTVHSRSAHGRVRSGLLRQAERRLSSEHKGRAEDSFGTSRRFHEASHRVIVLPNLEPRLFVITGKAIFQPFQLAPNPGGVVVSTASDLKKKVDRRK